MAELQLFGFLTVMLHSSSQIQLALIHYCKNSWECVSDLPHHSPPADVFLLTSSFAFCSPFSIVFFRDFLVVLVWISEGKCKDRRRGERLRNGRYTLDWKQINGGRDRKGVITRNKDREWVLVQICFFISQCFGCLVPQNAVLISYNSHESPQLFTECKRW